MYETSLDKVLNYMKQYVENRFEHDSEPMLNYKDLELVLNYIDKQKEILDKIKEKTNKMIESNNSALSNPEYTIVSKHQLLKLSNEELKDIDKILNEILDYKYKVLVEKVKE